MAEEMNEWRTLHWKLPKSIRNNFWAELRRCGTIWGCVLPEEPTNEVSPALIAVLERLSELMRETPDEVYKRTA